MSGIQFGEAGGRSRDRLQYDRDRRERMNGAHNVLIKLSIISYEADAFAVTFRNEEGGRTPISGLITLNDDPGSYVFCDFRRGSFLKAKRYRSGSRDAIGHSIVFQKNLHPLRAHRLLIQSV